MKRAALYIRVSSQGQVRDGYSMQFQEEILREHCQREEYLITGIYREGGQSGAYVDRKELPRLIEDARQKRFDVVLIFRVDRFSRDPIDLLALVRELEHSNIKLRSVTEAVDASDPAGELMLTILGAIGKFVRQNIIQNVMLGKTKRAQTGRYTGGRLPFGYVVDENGTYQPDTRPWWNGHSAAEVLGLVFKNYVGVARYAGGCKQVAKQFNETGVPGPKGPWSHASIYQMLTNPCYAGDFAWNKRSHQLRKRSKSHDPDEWVIVPEAHEPLVDRQTWDEVQRLLKQNKKYAGRSPVASDDRKDFLTGFLQCGHCGGALSPRRPSKNQKYLYYSCLSRYSEKRQREGSTCTDFPWVRADELEELIWGALVDTAGDPQRIEAIRNRIHAGVAPELGEVQSEIARLEKRRQALEQQATEVTTAHFDGKMPEYVWQNQLDRIEKERVGVGQRIEEARTRLAELEAEKPLMATTAEIQVYLQETLAERATLDERREALAILVGPRGIRVMRDGTVDFDIKIPLEIAAGVHTANPSVLSRPAR